MSRSEKVLVIIGAGGHGKVAADIAEKNGYSKIIFLDDSRVNSQCLGHPVLGPVTSASSYPEADFFVAIGNSRVRETISNSLSNQNLNIITLIHPASVIGSDVLIGDGSIVMAGAVINPGARIGNSVIVNTSASVDHDNQIGDYSHISVGAHIAGSVIIGKHCWIGAGSTVINNLSICDHCYLGAGSLTIRNLTKPGLYYGIPCSIRRED